MLQIVIAYSMSNFVLAGLAPSYDPTLTNYAFAVTCTVVFQVSVKASHGLPLAQRLAVSTFLVVFAITCSS